MIRDNQRARVYRAENIAFSAHGSFWAQTIPNHALDGFVADIMAKRAVRSRWGARHITVTLKRGGKALGYTHRISLPKGGRNPWVVCHEVAHCLTNDHHGPEFAGVYLFLVRLVMGKQEADRLRGQFKAERVKVQPVRKPRYTGDSIPNPHPMTVAARKAPRTAAPKAAKPKQPRQPGKAAAQRLAAELGVRIISVDGNRYDGWRVEMETPDGYRFSESDAHGFWGMGDDNVTQAWRDAYAQLSYGLTHCVDDYCDCGRGTA